MKSIVGKSVTVVLLLAVASGLAAWLLFGDKISAALSGEPQTVSPLTAPVERGSVQQTVTGVGEVKPLETVKLRPADSWHWLQSFDAPLNKRVAAGETLVTYANGEKWAAPYDLVVTSRELPEKNKGAVTKDDHYIEVQRIDTVSVTMEVSEKDLGLLSEGQCVNLLESVSKTYEMGEGVVRALDHVDLQVDQGDFLAIVGPSGSGKSTLMNILGLLDVPDEGRYLLDGMDVGALSDNRLASIRNEKIGFVFQSFNLLGKLTALENVKLPLSYAGVRLKEADARARKQLALVGLEGREHHLPNQLSGGQQQRVAIARALVCEPEIILADEPTGALDSRTGVEIMELFKSLHAEGQTVILITHNQELADEAQRVVRIADGLIQEMERGSHAV